MSPPPPPLVGTGSLVGFSPEDVGPEAGIMVGSFATVGSLVLPAVGADGPGAGVGWSPAVGSEVPPADGGAGAGFLVEEDGVMAGIDGMEGIEGMAGMADIDGMAEVGDTCRWRGANAASVAVVGMTAARTQRR